jgi:diguanylate cyclase (GGDEF)-like protein/putative nucleotidyltransferase with HDIG domain
VSDRTEQLLRTLVSIVSAVDDYLFAWHIDGTGRCKVIFESRPVSAFLGGDDPDPLRALQARIFPDDLRILNEWLAAAVAGANHVHETVRVTMLDGYPHLLQLHGVCTPEDDGMVIEGILKDAGSAERAHDELLAALTEAQNLQLQNELLVAEAETRARVDALTGAFNRGYFMECITHTLKNADDGRGGVGFVILDIDRFKSVNDTYGHPAGDAVLIEVAARLAGALRDSDLVARFGGEEFSVLLRGVADDLQLERVGERIRAAVSASPVTLPDGSELAVTASAGATLWEWPMTFEQLLDRADRGLYAAKRGGRNQLRLFTSLTGDELEPDEPEAIKLARGLALACSVREASPATHCAQVADLAGAIALHLGLGEATATRCRLGGWLHDIGKLGVPDRVLGGESGTEAERLLLRSHVELGAEIVTGMSVLRGAAAAVRHHHEKWDGTGYPDRLAGAAIPIDARIVAVADAWSAMRGGRPYQPALDPIAARAALRASAGTRFDPDAVAALEAVIDERELALDAGEQAEAA